MSEKQYLCLSKISKMPTQSINPEYVLAAIAAICLILAAVQATYILRRKSALKRQLKKCSAASGNKPAPISVIVFASNSNSAYLEESIPAIMAQNHPDFEVIVVNSDSSATTDGILTRLTAEYPSLRSTFIPNTSCNVSIRKLSATLGIKAATNDTVLLTEASCIPKSKEWLARISRHFDGRPSIVIGYCHYCHRQDKAAGHRYRSFDSVMTDSQYLAAAIRKHPYRGDRRNIAFSKQLFFDNKGYSRTMNLKYGDDDIFINEIAPAADNIYVELSDESILEMKCSNARDYYASEKAHRAFTLGKIHPKATTASSLITAIRCIYLILLMALIFHSAYYFLRQPENWLFPAISVGTAILIYLTETLIYISAIRKISGILHAPKQFFTTPVFRLTKPFANAYFRSKSAQADNYTWE